MQKNAHFYQKIRFLPTITNQKESIYIAEHTLSPDLKVKVIAPDGLTAYFSTMPIKKVVSNLKKQGVNCRISNSAGTYVCNAVYYAALHQVATRGLDTKCVFIHLPMIFDVMVGKIMTRAIVSLASLLE